MTNEVYLVSQPALMPKWYAAVVSPLSVQVRHPMPALCGLHNFNVCIKNQWGLCGVGVFKLHFWAGGILGLIQVYLGVWDNNYTRESLFFFSKKKKKESLSGFCFSKITL